MGLNGLVASLSVVLGRKQIGLQMEKSNRLRKNLIVGKTAEEKVSGILRNNYYDAEQYRQELTDSFNHYLLKPYRYFL